MIAMVAKNGYTAFRVLHMDARSARCQPCVNESLQYSANVTFQFL